jgi:type III pantothenate kinase
MILVLDVGNTNIVIGVYQKKKLLHNWRLSTNRSATVDEYGIMIDNLFRHAQIHVIDIKGVIISSVVPPLMFVLENLCIKYLKKDPLIVGPGVKTGANN